MLSVFGRVHGPLLLSMLFAAISARASCLSSETWQERVLAVPYAHAEPGPEPVLHLVRQDYEALQLNKSVLGTPLVISDRRFDHGLGTHSISCIRVYSPEPIARFSALVGVDANERTRAGGGSVVFSVMAGRRMVYRSGVLRGTQEAEKVDVDTGGASVLELIVTDGGDGPTCDHADWAEAAITTIGGKTMRLDEMTQGVVPSIASRYPFSFVFVG